MWSRGFRSQSSMVIVVSLFLIAFAGCSDDDKGGGQGKECGVGEQFNPISGECEPTRGRTSDVGTADGLTDGSGGSDGSSSSDTSSNPSEDSSLPSDLGGDADETCHPGVDSDGDGLSNQCECDKQSTDPNKKDTDGDGISDGKELGGDCSFDPGQGDTAPTQDDTDNDGLDDKEEEQAGTDPNNPDSDGDKISDGVEDGSCTDPKKKDTDGDGLPDGLEDGNQDGKLGTCTMRNYKVSCAQGESDPCKTDTDGNGTPDSKELRYRKCRPKDTKNLPRPKLITNMSGKYKVATEKSVKASKVSVSSGSIDAHVFEDKNHKYTGFVLNYNPNGTTSANVLAGDVAAKTQSLYTSSGSSYAVRRSTGRQVTTHDNFKAVVNSVLDIPNFSGGGNNIPAPKPHKARDQILAKIAGVNASNLSHNLSSTFQNDPNNPTLFVYEVVSRSSSEAIIVGALTTLSNYKDNMAETGFRVDDLTGGTSLAKPSETLETECVSFDITSTPKVDIIIALDASGSMSQEQKNLSNFATQFTNLLNQGNVDWRVGVTSVACSNIKNDSNLTMAFRSLWPSGGGFTNPAPCNMPIGGGFGGSSNGQLVGGDFTTSPTKISNRLSNVNGTNSEFAGTMGIAAVDRARPRMNNSKTNLRKDAAVIIVSITDENDGYFGEKADFGGTKTLNASQQAQVDKVTDPFINYMQKKKVSATMFGLYWPPGEQCGTASEVAHGIADVVKDTGGNGGSVCQTNVSNTLKTIATAAAGLGSGIRLLGIPVAPSLQVKHIDMSTGMNGTLNMMPRSRHDGFDYDSIVNRISFIGPNPPKTNDRVIIPYLRWKNSVKKCTKKKNSCPNKQVCVSGVCR